MELPGNEREREREVEEEEEEEEEEELRRGGSSCMNNYSSHSVTDMVAPVRSNSKHDDTRTWDTMLYDELSACQLHNCFNDFALPISVTS